MYLHEFMILAIVHFIAVIIPGPDFVVVVQQSISNGRKKGIYSALGIGCGISIHVAYTILGFGLIIQTNNFIFNTFKIISVFYIFYLGFMLIKSNLNTTNLNQINFNENNLNTTNKSAFIKGFLTNATNPKATIFFIGIFATIVSQQTPIKIQFLYGLWMCFVNAGWFMLVACLFTLKIFQEFFFNKKKILEIFLGMILVILSIFILFDL